GEYASWVPNEVWFSTIADDPRVQRLHLETELLGRLPVRLARQKNEPQARAELAQTLQTSTDAAEKMRTEAATLASLGEDDLAARKLEAGIADKPDDDHVRFWGAAVAYGMLSHIVEPQSPERARAYADRALELIYERAGRFSDWVVVSFRRELRRDAVMLE